MKICKMRRPAISRNYLLFLVVPLVLGLFSCPKIIDEALVRAVVDSLDPVVKVTSPLPNETYSSHVTVLGTVTDDSINVGDGDGLISSIAFDVANDDFRRGKILISSNGTVTPDPSGGASIIDWVGATKTFSFEIDTITPSVMTGPLVITIEVEDTNSNLTVVQLTLLESPGPYIDLEEPGNTVVNYQQGITHLDIYGIVANTLFDQSSASEVKRLSWRSGTKWSGDLDLSPTSTDWDAVRGLYVADNIGFFVPEEFTFDPVTLEFMTGFFVPSGAGDIMQIEVSAEDYNGHVSSVMVFLYEDTSGPQVTLISVSPFNATDGKSYYSSASYSPKPVVVYGNVLEFGTVSEFEYQVTGPGYSDSGTINTAAEPGFGTFATDGMFTLTMDDIDLTGVSSFATVTLLVTDTTNATTRATFQVFEDGAAPVISPGVMSSGNAYNASYAKAGDTVTLTFTVDDGGKSGIDGTPEVWIAGHDRTANVIPQGSGVYTVSYDMAPGDGSDADVIFSIDAVDIVGNVSTTVTQTTPGGQYVMFYEGEPTLSGIWIESDNPNSDWSKVGDDITLHFHSNRDLLGDPTVDIATGSSLVDSTNAPDYEASYQMTASDAEGTVSFSVDFTDAAGNAVSSPVTAITMGTDVTFDKTPPAVITGAVEGPAIVFTPDSGWRPIGSSITMQIRAYDQYSLTTLSASSVTINGESVSALAYLGSSGANSLYTVTYTVGEGDADIADGASVPISVILADRAGNTNTPFTTSPASGLCPTIDAHRPTISSTASFNPGDGQWVKAGESIDVTITASDTMTATLVNNSVTVNGEVTTGFTKSGDDYTVTYTVSTGDTQRAQNESIPVYVDVEDAAGNSATRTINPSASLCPGIDTLRPSVSLSFGGSEPTNDSPFTVSIAFSEAVNPSTFTTADITVNTGSKSNLSTSDNRNWTVDITPPSSTYDGSIDISIPSGGVQDPAGNTNTGSNTLSVDYDGEKPDVGVTLIGGGTQTSPFDVRITFTEAIDPLTFTAGDISVSPGSAGSLSTSDDRVWTATITPSPEEYTGDVDVSVPAGRAQDPAGNNNTASNTLTVGYDGS